MADRAVDGLHDATRVPAYPDEPTLGYRVIRDPDARYGRTGLAGVERRDQPAHRMDGEFLGAWLDGVGGVYHLRFFPAAELAQYDAFLDTGETP